MRPSSCWYVGTTPSLSLGVVAPRLLSLPGCVPYRLGDLSCDNFNNPPVIFIKSVAVR